MFINDRPITNYNLEWLREQLSYIVQDSELLDITIKESIKFGKKKKKIMKKI